FYDLGVADEPHLFALASGVLTHNSKPNAMPESVTDRLSTRHEHLFMFTKSRRYWFDLDPIREALARPEALDEGIVFGGKNTDVEIGRASCRERVEDSVSERTEAERG